LVQHRRTHHAGAIEETERLLPHLGALGDQLEASLRTLQQRHPAVLQQVRRAGMMFALHFKDESTGDTFLIANVRARRAGRSHRASAWTSSSSTHR